MSGQEPGGKNHSTDGSGAGSSPTKAELNGEHPQGADGDGCLGAVQDRPSYDYEDHIDDVLDGEEDREDLEAEMNCSIGPDGQCGQAGSEYCDLECPYRDGN